MNNQELINLALQEGFEKAAVVKTSDIPFDFSFRKYCAADVCGMYGKNYSCPPDCGSPEEMRQRVINKSKALVLQSVWKIQCIEDELIVRNARFRHNAMSIEVLGRLQEMKYNGFLIGASYCMLCGDCKLMKNQLCPHEDIRYSCLSAYCICAKGLAEMCDMQYEIKDCNVSFFGLYVYD